jgi:hypothetical protein
MTSEQIAQLLKLIERIADRPFTITQATDWPMVVVFFGIFSLAIGLFWRDVGLRIDSIKEIVKEFKVIDCKEHETLKKEFERGDQLIWDAMKDCQADCCPRGVRQ